MGGPWLRGGERYKYQQPVEMRNGMMVLLHIDWAGTPEELKELDEAYKKACEKTEGVDYKGRLVPWNAKYHFTYFLEMDDIRGLYNMNQNMVFDRDYVMMTHGEYEIYSVPS